MIGRRGFLAAGIGAACATRFAAWPASASVANGLLTATDVHVKDYPTVEAVRWIGEQLERDTDGRLRIDINARCCPARATPALNFTTT